MDPVSVAASIVGLITAAFKISEVLMSFIKAMKRAPKLAHDTLGEVTDIKASLFQLQGFLTGNGVRPPAHEHLLKVDQIRVVLSNCMLVFAQLEELVEPLKSNHHTLPALRVQWTRKEQRIQRLLRRLKSSEKSLTLMLVTLTCTTVHEAQSSVDKLQSLVIEVLEGNREMSRRLLNMETQSMAPASTKNLEALREGTSVDSASLKPHEDYESSVTIRKPKRDSLSEASEQLFSAFKKSFDKDLQDSRPYIRASKNRASWSATSSAIHTIGWSCLSGLSISKVSQISVINLPISPHELTNGQHYLSANDAGPWLQNITEEELPTSLSEPGPGEIRKDTLIDIKISPRQADTHLPNEDNTGKRNSLTSIKKSPRQANMHLSEKDSPCKIVLLGGTASGKTTVNNHLQMLYGDSFTPLEYLAARDKILHDVLVAFKGAGYRVEVTDPFATFEAAGHRIEVIDQFDKLCEGLKGFWEDSAVQGSILVKDSVVAQNMPFYIQNLQQLSTENYMVSDDLFLRAYIKTIGRYCSRIKIDQVWCDIYDSSCERNVDIDLLWGPRLTGRDTIIFVVSLLDLCRIDFKPYPKGDKMHMHECLESFQSLTQNRVVENVPIVVLLNMVDLIDGLIMFLSISDTFPDCPAITDSIGVCEYFKGKFASLDQRPEGKLHIYAISAVDRMLFEESSQEFCDVLIRSMGK